jgi:hypothetical protein
MLSFFQLLAVKIEFLVLSLTICLFLLNYFDVLLNGFISFLFQLTSIQINSKSETKDLTAEVNNIECLNHYNKNFDNPFGWLEDVTIVETKNWIEKQFETSQTYFESLEDLNKDIKHNLIESQAFEVIESPFQCGKSYFFFKKLQPDQIQFSLYATDDLYSEANLVFDPNSLEIEESTDSSLIIVYGTWISTDGLKLAFGYKVQNNNLNSKKNDEMFIGVFDLKNQTHLKNEIIRNCRADTTNVTWLESRTGFFYTTTIKIKTTSTPQRNHPEQDSQQQNIDINNNNTEEKLNNYKTEATNSNEEENIETIEFLNRVLFHRLDTDETTDLTIFELVSNDDVIHLSTQISSDGHYLLLEIFSKNRELASNTSFRPVNQYENLFFNSSDNVCIGNKFYYFDLSKFDGSTRDSIGKCTKLIDTFLYRFSYISNIEEDFWFRTNFKAKKFRVVRISLPDLTAQHDVNDCSKIDNSSRKKNNINNNENSRNEQATMMQQYLLLDCWKNCLEWIPENANGHFLERAGFKLIKFKIIIFCFLLIMI